MSDDDINVNAIDSSFTHFLRSNVTGFPSAKNDNVKKKTTNEIINEKDKPLKLEHIMQPLDYDHNTMDKRLSKAKRAYEARNIDTQIAKKWSAKQSDYDQVNKAEKIEYDNVATELTDKKTELMRVSMYDAAATDNNDFSNVDEERKNHIDEANYKIDDIKKSIIGIKSIDRQGMTKAEKTEHTKIIKSLDKTLNSMARHRDEMMRTPVTDKTTQSKYTENNNQLIVILSIPCSDYFSTKI